MAENTMPKDIEGGNGQSFLADFRTLEKMAEQIGRSPRGLAR